MGTTSQQAKQTLNDLTQQLAKLTDAEIATTLNREVLIELMNAIWNPIEVKEYSTIAEFFLAQKYRSATIGTLRDILRFYTIKGVMNEAEGYVSPTPAQWFDDGVMFLEGPKPHEGYLAVYRNGDVSYAIAKRDAKAGEKLGLDDFEFIDIDNFRKKFREQATSAKLNQPDKPVDEQSKTNSDPVSTVIDEPDQPLEKLKALLNSKVNDESQYQELFIQYPWMFGLRYIQIQRHAKLDDRNIPDFTGIRVTDSCSDIFEIKPPFMKIFTKTGKFSDEFNEAWNQVERYLDFARLQRAYLRDEKGLKFDHPVCILLCGYNLNDEELNQIRVKQRANSSIDLMTYNDLVAFATNTINFRKQMVNPSSN